MFSSGCSLKYSKKRNQWENSTQSLTIDENAAYSYGQKIVRVYTEYTLLNGHRFSVTTSGHQNIAHYHSLYSCHERYFLDCNTLNDFDGQNLETLKVSSYTDDLKLFVEKYFPKKAEKFLDAVKKKDAENLAYERQQKSLDSKIKKLESLEYKSLTAFKKALADFKKDRRYKLAIKQKYRWKNGGIDISELKEINREILKIVLAEYSLNSEQKEEIEKILSVEIFGLLGN